VSRLTGEALRKQAARQAVNVLVRRGDIPHPRDSFCFDCRGEASQYDHFRGYEGSAVFDVQPVCVKCHVIRSMVRGEKLGRSGERMPGRMRGFGGRVWRHRLAAGLSREGLALRAGYRTEQQVAAIEKYTGWNMHWSTVMRMATGLGVEPGQLLRGAL
jgi:hypothetical protein